MPEATEHPDELRHEFHKAYLAKFFYSGKFFLDFILKMVNYWYYQLPLVYQEKVGGN
jgi:hypothetical protein